MAFIIPARALPKRAQPVQILVRLDAYRAYPDFNNYLAFIFVRGEDVPVEVSGLLPCAS